MNKFDLKDGMLVRNTKTGNVGIAHDVSRTLIYNMSWVEVHIEKSLNGKSFTAFWSLKNIEPA